MSNMKKADTRLIALSVFGMSGGLLWDAWWHVAVGRDEFWIPPHITLYVCLTLLLVVSFLAWRKTKIVEFKNLFFISLLFPITGVLDQFWHSIFGVEDLISPIVVWSPPHLLILASLIVITLYTRKVVSFDESTSLRWLMRCGVFAGFLGFVLIFTMPFFPLGSYHIIGFWGAGFLMFVWVAITLYEQRKIKQTGTVILVTTLFMMLASIGPMILVKPAPGILIGALHMPPLWVFTFSFIVPAIFIEAAHSWTDRLQGLIAGTLGGAIFYFTAVNFIDLPFYGIYEIMIAVFSCALGGLIAGIVMEIFGKKQLQKNKN